MGKFREKNREGVNKVQENSRETTKLGSEMIEQAEQINAILESIELQDEEDIQAIGETGRSYQNSFDNTYSKQVESVGREIEQQGKQIGEVTKGELENVRSGVGKLEQAGDISDIHRDVAEKGRAKLEESAEEYEGITSDIEGVVDETKQQIESLKSNLSGIFG